MIKPLKILHGTGNQQAVHQTSGQQSDVGLLTVCIFFGVGNDEVIAVCRKMVLYGLDHGSEKLVGNIGHDKTNGTLLAGTEAAGGGIRRITQFGNCLINLLLRLLRNVAGIIDGVGHGGSGNTGQTSHVTNGHFHEHSPFLRKYALFCAIN